MHPWQLTQPVRQQIKPLTLWRSTFYAGDFPLQRPMRSFKELETLYPVFCTLCNSHVAAPQQGIGLAGQQPLDPIAEARGLRV
jgi:hypothetical protein